MRKRLSALLCVTLLTGVFCGLSACKASEQGPACVEIAKACSAVAEEGTFDIWASYGEDLYKDSFSNMYGVGYDMLEDGAILYTEEGGKADEISIMKLKKTEDVSLAKDKLEERIAERKHLFEGYKPEEVSKLEGAYVFAQGNYAVLLISKSNQKFETEIRTMISQGVK